ncbi:MAG TPA: acyl-CoA dehydrogenase family protein [Marmoricola sp.]|jgi:alkylation response protein AidB-like acyl-CoA dehydrogenase|nr:acyl-CoA dehydrogenase family protein [Marmoricola sp.]
MTELTSQSERDDLRESVRAFLAAKNDEAALRRAIESDAGYDEQAWTQMADQLGLQSLVVPEQYGGDGLGLVELGVVLEEMGRVLLPGPFFSTVVLAGSALAAAGGSAAEELLPELATGARRASLAVLEADARWKTDGFATSARPDGSGWRLAGEKSVVADGMAADVVVVAAQTDSGPALFAVTGDDGVSRQPLRTLDLTRRAARLTLTEAPAQLVAGPDQARAVLDTVLARATTALAAEQVGAARACLDLSVGYAKDRVQFGRVIGSFQAVKHKCADMFTRVQLADAAAGDAARAVDGLDDHLSAATASAVAHAVCSEAAMFVAMENIQVHGGIGFTWEHPAHLYFRRAKASQLMFGGPSVYFERVLASLGA